MTERTFHDDFPDSSAPDGSRRRPKRKGRWLRRIGIGIGVLLLLVIVAALVAFFRPGPPVVDYRSQVVALVEAAQPQGPDRWNDFVELVTRADAIIERETPPSPFFHQQTNILSVSVDAEGRISVSEKGRLALEGISQAGVFDELDAFAELPRMVRPTRPGALLNTQLAELGAVRATVRANVARMVLAGQSGDTAVVLQALKQNLAMAQLISRQPTLIDHLVSVATVSATLEELRMILNGGTLDLAALDEAYAIVEAYLPLHDVTLALEAERRAAKDMVDRILRREYSAVHQGIPVGLLAGARAQHRVIDLYFDDAVMRAGLTPVERRQAPDNIDKILRTYRWRYAPIHILLPAVNRASLQQHILLSMIDATRLHINVERYRLTHGQPPHSISDLVPEFYQQLPIDPYSGAPYVIRSPSADESAMGLRYVLYAFGADEDDDGGVTPTGARRRPEWFDARSDGDFVVNPPRPAQVPDESGS